MWVTVGEDAHLLHVDLSIVMMLVFSSRPNFGTQYDLALAQFLLRNVHDLLEFSNERVVLVKDILHLCQTSCRFCFWAIDILLGIKMFLNN